MCNIKKEATVSFSLSSYNFAVTSHFFFLFCLKTVDIYAVAVKLCAQK